MKMNVYSYVSNYGYSYLEARNFIFALIKIKLKYRKYKDFKLESIKLGK